MDILADVDREQMKFQQAIRHLLMRPLVLEWRDEDAEVYAIIVHHHIRLTQWFQEQLGWRLRVDAASGIVRLHKVNHRHDVSRGAHLEGKALFDERRYQLLCLTLSLLDESSGQTTLTRLADELKLLSSQEESIRPFDADSLGDRRAFVDVLRWLEEMGVLRVRDGIAERYVNDPTGDALYNIADRVLAQLLAAPRSPVTVKKPADMMEEVYAPNDEGARTRTRHRVLRALVDDPVVYYEDLGTQEQRWLEENLSVVGPQLQIWVGLELESRQQGVAAIDPLRGLSDTFFPDGGSTAKHAALLLADLFVKAHEQDGDGIAYDDAQVLDWTKSLLAEYGERAGWSIVYREASDGAARLASEALRLLENFRLVTRHEHGWRPRPAIARFAPGPTQGAGQ